MREGQSRTRVLICLQNVSLSFRIKTNPSSGQPNHYTAVSLEWGNDTKLFSITVWFRYPKMHTIHKLKTGWFVHELLPCAAVSAQ